MNPCLLRNMLGIALVVVLGACGDRQSDLEILSARQMEMLAVGDDQGSQEAARGQPVDLGRGFGAALRGAVERSAAFADARAARQNAAARVEMTSSALRPQITASVNAGGVRERGQNGEGATTGNVSLTQVIYDGGEIAANVDAASARSMAAAAALEAAGNEVALRAGQAWIDVWHYSTRLGLMHARSGDIRALADQIGKLIDGGMTDRASLAAAERQMLEIALEEERIVAALAAATESFHSRFGTRPKSLPEPTRLFDDAQLRALVAQRADETPELRKLAAEAVAAEREVAAAEALFSPNVQFRSGVVSPDNGQDEPYLGVGLVLRYVFNDGGRRKAEVEAREAQAESLRSRVTASRDEVAAALEGLVATHAALGRSLEGLEQQIELIDTERASARSKLVLGQSSIGQIVEIEMQSYRAESRAVEIRAERLAIELRVAATVGALAGRIGVELDDSQP
jgi:adhesin transport system outer membrane protein